MSTLQLFNKEAERPHTKTDTRGRDLTRATCDDCELKGNGTGTTLNHPSAVFKLFLSIYRHRTQ